MRRRAAVLLGFAVLAGIYTLLVTPKRFARCLPAPIRYLTRNYETGLPAAAPGMTGGNRVRLLVNGDEALPVILEMIAGAQESIRWQVMLFHPDEIGQELAAALAEAARRGVSVQLSFNIDQTVNGTIADGFSREQKERNRQEMQVMERTLRDAGVQLLTNPAGIDFPLDRVSADAKAVQQSIQDHACVSANHYDHRKILVVDGRLALTGGMNVGRSYLYHFPVDPTADMAVEAREKQQEGQPEAWEKWWDTAYLLEGPLAASAAAAFDWRWEVIGGQLLRPAAAQTAGGAGDGVEAAFLEQRPGDRQAALRFFQMVDGAQREILVASPFVSYDAALDALALAARRGVRVVIVVPNAHQEMKLSGRIFRGMENRLLDAGIEVYHNDLRMAHTKLMVVDGRQVMAGSFNLNYRSFLHDLEVALIVEDARFAQEVSARVFQPYLAASRRVERPSRPSWNPIDWLIKPFS